jgi:phage-related protein (TIGR01555 family)
MPSKVTPIKRRSPIGRQPPPRDASGRAIYRTDTWTSLMASYGTKRDPRENVSFQPDNRLSEDQLSNIYRSDGLARRIVDIVPDEGTRQWIEIEGDPEGILLDKLADIRCKQKINEAWCWARLYGGSIIVMLVDDGGELSDEVNMGNVRAVRDLQVYDIQQVYWEILFDDPAVEHFGSPKIYNVTPLMGPPFYVHSSRVLYFDGARLPQRLRMQQRGHADSVLQACYRGIQDLQIGHAGAANIVKDFIQSVISVTNLQELLSDDDGTATVKRRLDLLSLSRSILNVIILDKDEQYSKQASSVAGLGDLLDRFGRYISTVTGIPETKLFGRSPAGENATGESDVINFYDMIKGEQEDKILPHTRRLVDLVANAKETKFTGKLDEVRPKFKPLWQPDEKQVAETRWLMAQADDTSPTGP